MTDHQSPISDHSQKKATRRAQRDAWPMLIIRAIHRQQLTTDH